MPLNDGATITKGSNILTGNTATTVSVDSFNETASSDDYVYYLWHSVEGFSKFGVYAANGDADGPVIQLVKLQTVYGHIEGYYWWFLGHIR